MTEHPKQSLRFHDGIGDVLQERRSHRLSLLRPLWVSLTIGCVTILIFVAALNAVLNQLVRKKTLYIPHHLLEQTTQEQDNDAMIKEMEALLAQSAPPLTLPPAPIASSTTDPSGPASPGLGPATGTPVDPTPPRPKPSASLSVVPSPAPPTSHPARKPVPTRPTQATSKPSGPVVAAPTPPASPSNPLPNRPSPPLAIEKRVVSPPSIRYRVIMPQANQTDALAMRARLKTLGIEAMIKQSDTRTWLQLGAFQHKSKAEETMQYVASKGFESQLVAPTSE